MRKTRQGKQQKKPGQMPELQVGIFWLVDGKLLIDSTPISEAEAYGDHLTHPRGHPEVWEQYQRARAVPADMEYEECPRGRVMLATKTRRFTLLADRCILKRKDLVEKIKSDMRLPKNTLLDTDSHYRCFGCLYRSGSD